MNLLKRLSKLSNELTDILEEVNNILDNTDNNDLYNEIDTLVRADIENALTNLDITINDIEDGMYAENDKPDDDPEDLDFETEGD